MHAINDISIHKHKYILKAQKNTCGRRVLLYKLQNLVKHLNFVCWPPIAHEEVDKNFHVSLNDQCDNGNAILKEISVVQTSTLRRSGRLPIAQVYRLYFIVHRL